MLSLPVVLALLATALGQFVPSPGYYPPTGDNTIAGGIFSISLTDLIPYEIALPPNATGSESPTTFGNTTSGSGPYPAHHFTTPLLPNHTIYAPITTPPNKSLPFLSWANGACMIDGSLYVNFLTEIASHGYVISQNGLPNDTGSTLQSAVQDSRNSINFAAAGHAARWGVKDPTAIASMGHSCGGLEALSVSYHDARVKRVLMFDISIFQDDRRYLLSQITAPIAWFVGGPKDLGYVPSAKDYALLPEGLPAYRASLDTGHIATFIATNGGKFAQAAVAYLDWQFKGNATARNVLTDPASPGSLASENWQNITFKNWPDVCD